MKTNLITVKQRRNDGGGAATGAVVLQRWLHGSGGGNRIETSWI